MTGLEHKQRNLTDFLDRHSLDGVLLQQRNNFSWITCGRHNHVGNATQLGATSILAMRDGRRVCIANAIEAPRMRDEELAGLGIEVISYPWWDVPQSQRIVREVIGGRKIAADSDALGLGLPSLPADFAELRWTLTDEEIARYRDGVRRAAMAIETACREARQGHTEHDLAAMVLHHVQASGCTAHIVLVAADERVENFRHPIPTDRKVNRYAMLVVGSEFGGLLSSVTRLVSFAPLTPELKRKHQAVCNVDAAATLSTRPGRAIGEIFRTIQQAYADNGFADEWKLHHQGGSTGYTGRETSRELADSTVVVRENQAFAWNPSITGTKSEDTILSTAKGVEVLTAMSSRWPRVAGRTTVVDRAPASGSAHPSAKAPSSRLAVCAPTGYISLPEPFTFWEHG